MKRVELRLTTSSQATWVAIDRQPPEMTPSETNP
jgi:hypothetical protein